MRRITSDLEVGAIVREGLPLLPRMFARFFVIALVISSLPLLYQLGVDYVSGLPGTDPNGPAPKIVVGIVATALSYWLTVALVLSTVAELEDRQSSLGSGLRQGLPLVFPVIGVAILFWVGTGLSTILLVIPGVAFATIFYVAVPIAVIENPGIIASFRRSATLTGGYRWHIFRIFLLMLVLLIVGAALVRSAFSLLPLPIDESSSYYLGSYERVVIFEALGNVGFAFMWVIFKATYCLVYCKLRMLNESQHDLERPAEPEIPMPRKNRNKLWMGALVPTFKKS